jgi:hypothetical protein
VTELAHCSHCCQCACDNLRRPLAIHIVSRLGVEQFRMGEEDPQLVIQAVKERLKLALLLVGPTADDRRRQTHACEPGAVLDSESSERAGAAASRHRVSAKIRMDPPAVRTYSTLPAEIQL